MFYLTEDIQPAVDAATKIFGTIGNMSFGKNVMFNVVVATKEFGKLWYGDIEQSDISTALTELSTTINQKVYLLDDRFDFSTPILTSNN